MAFDDVGSTIVGVLPDADYARFDRVPALHALEFFADATLSDVGFELESGRIRLD